MNRSFTKWTDAEKDRLVELWRAEASGAAIARTLRRSERACIAMIARLRDGGMDLPMRHQAGRAR